LFFRKKKIYKNQNKKLLTAKNRKSFDPFNEDVSVVQTMNESTSIISLTESPIIRFFGLFQREFLLLTHGRSIDDKCYVISMNSILDVPIIDDDETDRNIPSPDIIRGLIIDSGWIIQQKSKGLSRLTYVIQVCFFFHFNFFLELTFLLFFKKNKG